MERYSYWEASAATFGPQRPSRERIFEKPPSFAPLVFGPMGGFAPPTTVEGLIELRSKLDLSHLNRDLPSLAEVHDHVTLRKRGDTELYAEIYVPNGDGPFPSLLYIHGGGWSFESAAGVRKLGMMIAAETDHVVVNLEYGLAPEHPFPWGLEDCVYTARWIKQNINAYRGDGSRIAIAGDSAGGNLAASTIVYLCGFEYPLDEGDLAGVGVDFSAFIGFYGFYDWALGLEEPGAAESFVALTHVAYLGPQFLRLNRHPLVSPAFAPNLDRFAPSYLTVGDEDALFGHALRMGKALGDAGTPITISVVAGLNHFFAQLTEHLPDARAEMDKIFTWLRRRSAAA